MRVNFRSLIWQLASFKKRSACFWAGTEPPAKNSLRVVFAAGMQFAERSGNERGWMTSSDIIRPLHQHGRVRTVGESTTVRILTKPKRAVAQVHDAIMRLVRWGLRVLTRLSQSIAPFGPIDAGLDGAHREPPMSSPAVHAAELRLDGKAQIPLATVRRMERIRRSKANGKPFHSY